ncbi:MAG TPA: Hsp33 family molecular chaperone HslO [Candidatus Copromorpha excrementigallinarum]|uniref:33 kDa chaperonin n=1 Tax=Candidatus Allocopromorpha excrementigallinarum TaxID=2840742 RepID=A0A9D1I1J7_9FIRM|nr:Hsp33 family molecular chaperone HslO [Candidatus Copromorpha excrementigallinarum]
MSNTLIALDKSGSYRVYIGITTNMVQQAADIHKTTPLASAGLGRVLTAAGLMGLMLKDNGDRLTVRFRGDGPAGQILAAANGAGDVKGYIANPYVDLPLTAEKKLDVGGSLGKGELTVIKDIGMKEPYVGTTALVSGEIAEDLAAYFFISEQQNSSVALGVRIERDLSIGAAGGMIIQTMPGAEEEAVDRLEELTGSMDPLTSSVKEIQDSMENAVDRERTEALLYRVFKGMPEKYKPEILQERDISWKCDCSRERMERALAAIGRKDLTEIIEEDGKAELQCHFCLKKYSFNREELLSILERARP